MPNDSNVISTLVTSLTHKPESSEPPAKTEKVPDLVGKPNNNIEPPITEYEAIKGIPYTAKYFKLNYWSDLAGNKKFDVSSVHDNVMKIEKYINEKIVNEGLKNDKLSYESIMNSLKSNIGAKETELPERVIKRVSLYIDVLFKQQELNDKKERLLYGKFPNRKDTSRAI